MEIEWKKNITLIRIKFDEKLNISTIKRKIKEVRPELLEY